MKYLRDPGRVLRKLRWQLLRRGPRRDVTVDSWNGRLTFDSGDAIIGKYLSVDRAYERAYIERVVRLLREQHLLQDRDGLLLDVGANIGMICIALLRQGLFRDAAAFEPSPGNVRLLQRNVEQNGLADRIRVFPCALTSAPGTLELEISAHNSGDNRIRRSAAPGAYGEEARAVVRVPATTLTDALRDGGIDAGRAALIWVDIQGHEAEFLEGARDVIRVGLPVVSELWPYGILRSGTTRAQYMHTLETLFTEAWLLDDDPVRAVPIRELDGTFDTHRAPRQFREVMLLRRQ